MSQRKPKSVEILESVRLGKDESQWSGLKRFNGEVILVKNSNEKMKKSILNIKLQQESKFPNSIEIRAPNNFSIVLAKAKKYIQNEEKLFAIKIIYFGGFENAQTCIMTIEENKKGSRKKGMKVRKVLDLTEKVKVHHCQDAEIISF